MIYKNIHKIIFFSIGNRVEDLMKPQTKIIESVSKDLNYFQNLLKSFPGNRVEDLLKPQTKIIESVSKDRRMRRNEGRGHVVRTVIATATITRVSLLSEYTYVCNATNDAGSVVQKLKMNVHPKPQKPCEYFSGALFVVFLFLVCFVFF